MRVYAPHEEISKFTVFRNINNIATITVIIGRVAIVTLHDTELLHKCTTNICTKIPTTSSLRGATWADVCSLGKYNNYILNSTYSIIRL